jgi:hypothetical protein
MARVYPKVRSLVVRQASATYRQGVRPAVAIGDQHTTVPLAGLQPHPRVNDAWRGNVLVERRPWRLFVGSASSKLGWRWPDSSREGCWSRSRSPDRSVDCFMRVEPDRRLIPDTIHLGFVHGAAADGTLAPL